MQARKTWAEILASISHSWAGRYGPSFSYVGLVIATLFFAASLSPSLLPRHFAVQGILSGLALADPTDWTPEQTRRLKEPFPD